MPDGNLLIRKVCSVNPSVTLQDAEFKVMYADGTLIGDNNGIYRTDENGTIVVTVYPEEEKAISLYLTAQEQTAGSTAEAAKEGLAYAVSRRKITVNFVFGAAIA